MGFEEFRVGDIVEFIMDLKDKTKCQKGERLKVVDYDTNIYKEDTGVISVHEVNFYRKSFILVERPRIK